MASRQKVLDLAGDILAEAHGGCKACTEEPDLCGACSAAVERQVLSLEKAGLLARPSGNPWGRADVALLTDEQRAAIRYELKAMDQALPWAEMDLTEPFQYLYLDLTDESRPGRGHDCRWMWSNAEVIISGSADVYGNGSDALWCRPKDWWVTADGEEPGY